MIVKCLGAGSVAEAKQEFIKHALAAALLAFWVVRKSKPSLCVDRKAPVRVNELIRGAVFQVARHVVIVTAEPGDIEPAVIRTASQTYCLYTGSSLSQSQVQLRMASLTGRSEEAYEAALRQALEELTEVHQDALSFV
jgi:hypothetical protein